MKKLLAAAALAALMTGFSGAPAQAAPNWSQFCKSITLPAAYSHGDCTSILNGFFNKGQGANDASAFCKDIATGDPAFFDAFFRNHGDCVKQLKDFFPG